ncbi:unnamed protein product [Rhizoctonia solani]|uniref:Transmembrane protein n=1 Tax=Rhizoctonia solani TaxID=456999 RepID=A0A8H3AFW2_9AGAM|nr:unnamed protein product [Rhizoctonia solani]
MSAPTQQPTTAPGNGARNQDEDHTSRSLGVWIPWVIICWCTLGFPAKYRERLRLFEGLYDIDDPYLAWSGEATYSDRGDEKGSQKTMREKQQEEWDRLNITVSVITATSAAALAIQATSNTIQVYWLVTSFYSIAFGLSLEGLILITYMTIAAGGSSDEAITRIARGELILSQSSRKPSRFTKKLMIKLAAFIMALPAILATYSSMSLLLGLTAMVVAGSGQGVDTRGTQYIIVTIIPVGIGFLFLFTAIVICEMGNWTEIWGRRAQAKPKRLNSSGREPAGANPGSIVPPIVPNNPQQTEQC